MTEIGNGYKVEKIYTFKIEGVELRAERFNELEDSLLVSVTDENRFGSIVLLMERIHRNGWRIDRDYCKDATSDLEHFITDGASKVEAYINLHGAPPIEE